MPEKPTMVDITILEHLKKENASILEEGRPYWENALRDSTEARTAKDLKFDIKIIEQLVGEAERREEEPSPLYHLLVSYYIVRLKHIRYAENALEGLLNIFSNFMEKEIDNII